MVPIGIDISDVILEFSELSGRSEELSSFVLDRLVDSFMFDWESKVNGELKQTRQEYKKAMFVDRIDSYNAVLGLLPSESGLAMMIEDGASSWDMKSGFEKSSKKTMKADGGWYLTVPFRSATTEAIGESMMFSGKLPAEIQKIAKKVSPASIALQDLPKQYQDIGINKTSGYTHKSPIYVGTKRNEIGSTQAEKRGGYVSFRRVSDNSEDGSWQHPGFEAHKFMDKTANELESKTSELLDIAVDDFLTQLLG